MEQKKVYHVVLSEDQIATLGNLATTLSENEVNLKTIPDALDETDTPMNLWESLEGLLPALKDVARQLLM